MNSITHAYSVVAFLLILGCTLIGFPMSVFSQEAEPAPVNEQVVDEVEITAEEGETLAEEAPSSDLSPQYTVENLSGNQSFSDFVVGPGRFSLELEPGESETVEMTITNRMGTAKRFSITTEDAGGSDDPSQAVVLLGDQRGPYTARDYISVPQTEFELGHAQRVRIPVTVSLPADAEPGGRYGSLLVSIVSDPLDLDENSGARPGSVVISRIGTLFFITTPGSTEHDSVLQDFTTTGDKWLYSEGPISFSVVTENLGPVHVTPYGEIRIFNTAGNEVGFVELDPWFVMPKSLRLREVSWDRELLIGRYTAVAKINRGYDDIVDEKSYSFWVIPWKLIAVAFVGLFVFFLLLRFVFSQFEFKRKGK